MSTIFLWKRAAGINVVQFCLWADSLLTKKISGEKLLKKGGQNNFYLVRHAGCS